MTLAQSLTRSLSLLAAVAVLSSACSDGSTAPDIDDGGPNDDTGATIADLVGSWTASSVVFTNKANAAEQIDIVAAGGELRTTVLNHGGARTWLTFGLVNDEWDAQLTLNGDQLTSTPVESTRPTRHYTVALAGDQLTMTSSDATFDFTLSGADAVAANQVIVFVRQ